MTKANVLELNAVLAPVRFKLEQAPCIALLTLKSKLSGLVEAIDRERTGIIKTVLKELGYSEGETIPSDRQSEVSAKLTGVITNLLSEEVVLETSVLSVDELYTGILANEENASLTAEQKAVLMRYLVG